ncbi:putative elongator complex protein 1 [Vanessa cardui]|uniref:putative elongator complex protein 1 n=1 Tax=Vanessa cardui TaxID=171605 RepID=UPI001F12D2FB|nr:putative elongator complex protein 1 [Vanessa cardui]
MRNLCMWQVCSKKGFCHLQNKFCVCYGHHEDSRLGEIFMCSHSLVVSSVDSSGEVRWTRDLSEISSPDNRPINITLLSLLNSVSIGLANGELFTISNFEANCELVGVCDNGLVAMEWSPDQELLVLVTNDLNVILMSCTFDAINESNLLSEEFGENQFITVGWGKKETQFHGSEGKQAAKIKTEVISGNTEIDDKIIISWRGDGSLFAVGFTMDGIRRFKVFDREGNLQFTSEKQPGLEANLSWRPSGNLIATTQQQGEKKKISFFEKNGLKHGEFVIPISSTTIVEDLLWSFDSEILTILCKDTVENIHKVLLYTTSNYHWYLKQTLVFKQGVSKIMWDNDFDVANNKKMHVLLLDGHYFSYTWIWTTDHSKGKNEDDDAVVAVIDGKKVLVSTFRHAAVPPPMANLEIKFDSEINSVHFAPENSSKLNINSFVVTTSKSLVFVEQTNRKPLQYNISKTIALDDKYFSFQHYNWHLLDNETLLCVSVDSDNCYEIIQYKISEGSIVKEHTQSLPSAVTRIQCHPKTESAVFLQLDSGDILEYCSDGTITPQEVSFPEACPKFSAVAVDNDVYFLGLSHKGCLYLMDEMVINNISSFFVHSDYLLLTTLKHMLLCVELTKVGLGNIASFERMEKSNIYKRKIERGAKLVISVPKDTRTVFQMPRGNLETIQPRPLSLKIIGEYLDSKKYFEAFDLMRKQRINLNLIYDHNPNLFIQNIDVFLNTIQSNSWLSLFLSDLENVDVTKTMYSSSYTCRENISEDKVQKKVQFICDLVRLHLTKASDSANRVLPLLTTFVKKNTVNDLEEALILIKELKNKESGGTKLPVTSDEALKYLLYMVNVDNLFDVALGMYDFDLVLLVANKSQKDPKEYISMLNDLNEMDEDYRKYTINKHLKRFDRAVQCLAKCGPSKYGELKTFVKYHSLYRMALALFPIEDEIYHQISDDFGLYLKLKKQYIEAGIIYERAGKNDKAIECYKEALEWELALKLAEQSPREEFKRLCWDLATMLKDERRFKEAISILEQFSEDSEDIINFAIECGQYKAALRMCSKFNNSDFKDTKVLPSLIEEYKSVKDLLQTNGTNFIKYRNRLKVVREIKNKKSQDDYETPNAYKDSDLYSDAGSTIASSSGSGKSFRSSKNRRKHERKVASLKEGSQYEDTALVLALHSLITSTYELRPHVKEVNIALSCFNKDDEASILQSSLEKLLKEMKDSLKQIWSNEFTLEATNAVIAAENVSEGSSVIPQGIATLEPQLRIAPVIQDFNWKLDGLNNS